MPSAPARGEAVDALTKAEDDKTQPNTGERTGSWADVIGPVMRLKDVARLTGASVSSLRRERNRNRLFVLETLDGTEVVPASHFDGDRLVVGLPQVLSKLNGALFAVDSRCLALHREHWTGRVDPTTIFAWWRYTIALRRSSFQLLPGDLGKSMRPPRARHGTHLMIRRTPQIS